MKKDILQIAHRGNSQYYKDNTNQAITSAIIEGFSMIEIDIQICKTGEIIVFHDTYIKDKMIEDMSYSEIIKCCNDILKLEEVFDISGISNIKLYLDLKGSLSLVNAIIKFFSICWTMLNNKTCAILHGMGIKIFTYTCENDTILNKILRYNIDGIVTNYKLIFY